MAEGTSSLNETKTTLRITNVAELRIRAMAFVIRNSLFIRNS